MKPGFVLVICCAVLLVAFYCTREVHGQDACNQPANPGNCYAYFENYYFDAPSGGCRKFVYGGCGGNNNRFDTIEACQRFRRLCLRKSTPNGGW